MKTIENTPNCTVADNHDLVARRFRGSKRRSQCNGCGLWTGWVKQTEVVAKQKATLQKKVDEFDDTLSDDYYNADAEREYMQGMVVSDLKAEARALNIKGYSKMKKDDLIEAIIEQEMANQKSPALV